MKDVSKSIGSRKRSVFLTEDALFTIKKKQNAEKSEMKSAAGCRKMHVKIKAAVKYMKFTIG